MSIDTQDKLRYCALCANLEQMRSLDQNAIEAKDHKIVLLEQANAKLEAALAHSRGMYEDICHDYVSPDFDGKERTRDEMKKIYMEDYDAELNAILTPKPSEG